jgi:hypothetical protein
MAAPPLAIALGFMAVNGATAAAGILALYLAVMFQTFGAPQDKAQKGAPFRSGFRFERGKHGWKNFAVVLAAQVAFLVGGGLALADKAEPFVAASLAFMAVLVGIPQMLWGLRQVANDWANAHPHAVLNAAFTAPVIAAVIAALVAGL